jgi:hypothetical protein
MKANWAEVEIKINDLKEYGRNPRRMSKDQYNNLVKSLKEDGYHNRMRVDLDGTIIGGHQRKKALLSAGFKKDDKIPVLMPLEKLSPEEFKRMNVQDNLSYGEYDFDMLATDFDVAELIEWGMPDGWLPSYEEPEQYNDEHGETPDKKTVCPACGSEF